MKKKVRVRKETELVISKSFGRKLAEEIVSNDLLTILLENQSRYKNHFKEA